MKNYKSWLDDVKYDNNLDYTLENDDCYFNHEVGKVVFPHDEYVDLMYPEDEVA